MEGLKFHPIPTVAKKPTLRAQWLNMIRREKEWTPNTYTRVCDRHFPGAKGPTDSHPTPTLFPYNSSTI